MTTHTTQYWFIEAALAAHTSSFNKLEARMDAFQALPLAAFEHERQRMWSQMRPINEGKSDDDLWRFIDSQISLGHSPEWQRANAFLEPFAAETIAITVLAHALAEATINAAIALGLEHVGKTELFLVVEQANLKHKWTSGPLCFLPTYTFPRSESLHEGLAALCRRRNAYVHSKITLRGTSNEVLLPGSTDPGMAIGADARALVHRFLRVPYELHKHLVSQIDDQALKFKLLHILGTPPVAGSV
jgi:hypothetical protein